MRVCFLLALAWSLGWAGTATADAIDAYLPTARGEAVYVHVVMDLGDTAVDRRLCTFGVDCGPPFTSDSAHRHLGDMYLDGEAVTAPGLFRAVLAAVIEEPRFDDLHLSLLISNHQDNAIGDARPGAGGGTILRGYGKLQQERAAYLRTLKSIPHPSGSAAHAFQPKETYFEWLRYIAGGDVALGRNTQGNFAQMYPDPDFDAGIIADGRYRGPFRDEHACPRLYSILFTQGAAARDDDLDTRIGAELALPGRTSFERLLSHLHESTTDLLPQIDVSVPLQRTWVVTSGDRPGNVAELAAAGKGAVLNVDDPQRLQSELTLMLASSLRDGGYSLDTVFVEDTFRPGRVLDDVFIPLFSPQAHATHRGNVKKLKLKAATVRDREGPAGRYETLVDARGQPAIETDGPYKGQLRFDALTYWTDAASLPPGDGSTVPVLADGRVVARGGAGQKIDGLVNYAADPDGVVGYFIGDTNADAPVGGYGPRQLYFEPAAGAVFAPMDANAPTVEAIKSLLDPAGDLADVELLELIRWARGQDTAGDSPAARHWLLGEVMHSRPLALNYGATSGYSPTNPNIRVMFGSGEGVFHIVENTDTRGRQTGRELFGFYPRESLTGIRWRREPGSASATRHHGVDGAPVVLKHDRNRDGTLDHTDGDTAWVYFGLRRGGSSYFALDVSDPDALPRLMWKISSTVGGDFDALGMTFSTPVVGKVNYGGASEDVVIFAGGYHGGWNADYSARIGKDGGADDDAVGNAIYIVSARTGELIWKAESGNTGTRSNTHYEHAGLVDSIPSQVSALVTSAGVIHRLYVGDSGGAVWRVDLPPNPGSGEDHRRDHWFITKLADLGADAAEAGGTAGDDRRFFHAPDVVQSFDGAGEFDGVLIQSGDREHPNETVVQNVLFYIKDRHVQSGSDLVREEDAANQPGGRIQYTDLEDRTTCTSAEQGTDIGDTGHPCGGTLGYGWKLRFARPGEKGLASPVTDGGRVFASTFVPGDAAICPATPGRGYLHAINLADASAIANGLRSFALGEGIPAAVERIGDTLYLPGGGANLYDLDGDAQRDNANLLPSQAVPLYRIYWREPGVDSP